MTTGEASSNKTQETATTQNFDMKLEVIVIPVSNVDRAKAFYTKLGWRLDADRSAPPNFRLIQFTPPGSATSIQFGTNLTTAAPGSTQNSLLAVSEIQSARQQLIARGIDASEVFHCTEGTACRFPGQGTRVNGLHPEAQSYFSFVSFQDPDGNTWLLQEVTKRLAGRVAADITTFTSANDLAQAMRRASNAHAEHEKRTGQPDPNWPDWYANYIIREQSGQALPQ
jgi:catechol 2,3-dioxygenase-like lactoylglutathione lyase family enzyme